MNQADLAAKIKELAFVALLAFCAMPFYVGYWAVVREQGLKGHPLNKRAEARMARTKPGRLLSSDGEEMLGRRGEDGGPWKRVYPSPRTFCHLTGYDRKTGLQLSLGSLLLQPARRDDPLSMLRNLEPIGCDVELTISADGQRLARRLLSGQRGAIVALDPKTGAVLVLASAPTFDPTRVLTTEEWKLFTTDPDSPALNRAVQGLYPPGSIFKLITAAAAVEGGVVSADTEYVCEGSTEIEGREVRCWKRTGHGRLDLSEAVAQSCNVYFAHLGRDLGAQTLSKYAKETGLFRKPRLSLPENAMAASRVETEEEDDLAAASFALGQGDLQITPFAAAQVAAAVANEGVLMTPNLVKAVLTPDGQVRQRMASTPSLEAFRPSTARLLAGMMETAVESGTGQAAGLTSVRVAGKTGSAQTPSGAAHAWFVGFAPAQDPRIAVAVIVEHGGSGGAVAAPMARDIMAELLR